MMKTISYKPLAKALQISALLLAISFPACAQDSHDHDHKKKGSGHSHGDDNKHEKEAPGHSHEKAEGHGGGVVMTKAHHFEVVYYEKSVRIYVYDSTQNAIDPKGASGTVFTKFRKKGRSQLSGKLKYVSAKKEEKDHDDHGAKGYLEALIDFSKLDKGGAKSSFTITGLSNSKEKKVSFKDTFALTMITEFVCPMKCVAPSHKAGKCSKCGMALKPVKYLYRCPMHPRVESRKSKNKCWTCKMALVKSPTTKKSKGGDDHGDHDH